LQIGSRSGAIIIFITHPVAEVALLADHVVMSTGSRRDDSDFRIDLAPPRDVSSPKFSELRRDFARGLAWFGSELTSAAQRGGTRFDRF
jgi:ABC-type nitrate/sulfonate/bicarbonate transport system ATPase subunit